MDDREWREFVQKLRQRWSLLWKDRIDDKVRAEGIASEDYDLLFVDRGMVIVATKDYKPPNLGEILKLHADGQRSDRCAAPNPRVGGWGKFVRDVINKQERFTKRGRPVPSKLQKRKQQLKKGGKGWLHIRM